MNAQQLERQATTLRNHGKGYEAVGIYEQAKDAYLQEDDPLHAAGCQHMIGVSYKIENDLEQALPAYNQAIDEYNGAGDVLGEGRVERDIGVMYEYHDHLEEAMEHLEKSKTSLQTAPETATTKNGEKRDAELGITLAKLGLVALRMSRFDQAESSMMDGLSLIRKAGHPFYEMTALYHLSSLYFATQHYGRMLANLEAALGLIYEYNMQDEQQRRLAQIWGMMAHGYLHSDNPDTARHFAKKSFAIINTLSESAQKPLKKDIDAARLAKVLAL
jgi:tetratricopeptide (TPR) repeat protein